MISSESPNLSAGAFAILRDLIHERVGLFYQDDKRDILAEKLSRRVAEVADGSFLDYYYLLKYGHENGDEWLRLVDALSTPETYFWREADQLRALVELVMPEVVERGAGRPVRVWCAACASGEEPLSIAMALDDADWFARAPVEIIATDASPLAIERARRAVYRERSVRNLPVRLREKYLSSGESGWSVAPALAARVDYRLANLLDPGAIAPLATAPIIFCRNVFIYFSADAIRKVVDGFAGAMPDGGYLFLGASESIVRLTDRLTLIQLGDSFVYKKQRVDQPNS